MSIPLRTRLLYGTSRVGSEALGKSSGLWLLYYYAPPSDANLPTLLPSLAVGVLLTLAGIVAALDDAIVGYLSDRTRSRLGRRIPYIVLGAPLWSIFFVLLFTPPPDAGNATTASSSAETMPATVSSAPTASDGRSVGRCASLGGA